MSLPQTASSGSKNGAAQSDPQGAEQKMLTPQEKENAIREVEAHPEMYSPLALYETASLLFEADRKDEAAFWFYAAQLRARFDMNRAGESSADFLMGFITQGLGEEINPYAFQDLDKLEKLIQKVVKWDRETPHKYDYRWVYFGDKTSSQASPAHSQEHLDEIAEKTRSNYLKEFQEVLKIKKGGGGYYEVTQERVAFHTLRRIIPIETDPATFKDLGGGFGRDSRRVYFEEKVVQDADPESFVVLAHTYGKDAKAVYSGAYSCRECDVRTFRKINDDFYLDQNAAYVIVPSHSDHWTRVPSADPQSVTGLNGWFQKDSQHAFFMGRMIPGADAESFKVGSCGKCEVCAEDKNRCYSDEYPVPCDCKPNSSAFSTPVTELLPGQALLFSDGGISVSSGYYVSIGYTAVAAGKHTITLSCWDKEKKTHDFPVDFEPGGFYRLTRKKGSRCDAFEIEIERPAMVRGSDDGPEIQIRMPGDDNQKPTRQAELSPGKHDLIAVCRDVTRTGVRQDTAHVSLEFKPGEIYQLYGNFDPTTNKCDVHPKLLTAPADHNMNNRHAIFERL
jgi:hypothetical protein